MRIRVIRHIQHTNQIILTDIIAECTVYRLLQAEHYSATRIAAAVIILIKSTVPRICIPCLSVSVALSGIQCVIAFIVLKEGILAFPWPDSGSHTSKIRAFVIGKINLSCSIHGYIVLYQRPVTVHCGDRISACSVYIIISDYHIRISIAHTYFITDFRCGKFIGVRPGIGCRNSPPVHIGHMTVLNYQIVESGNSRLSLIGGLCHDKINSAVYHMLIVNVAHHIMNIKIIQNNMFQSSSILCNTCHPRPVHYIWIVILQISACGILLISVASSLIGNFQTADFYVLHII